MPKAEYRSAVRSRKLIKAALADLLLEKPLDKITVTDVVRRAEINRGTFYAHYRDIADVLDHLIAETFEHIRDALFTQSQSIEEVPHVLLARVQSILEEDMDFYTKIMTSGAFAVLQEQLVHLVLDYLFRHEEDFSLGSHEQYVLLIQFCAGGLTGLYAAWFGGKLSISLSELTARAEKLLLSIITQAEPPLRLLFEKNIEKFKNRC